MRKLPFFRVSAESVDQREAAEACTAGAAGAIGCTPGICVEGAGALPAAEAAGATTAARSSTLAFVGAVGTLCDR